MSACRYLVVSVFVFVTTSVRNQCRKTESVTARYSFIPPKSAQRGFFFRDERLQKSRDERIFYHVSDGVVEELTSGGAVEVPHHPEGHGTDVGVV